MRPRERRDSGQNDLFKARLDQIVDTDHALAKLGRAIDCCGRCRSAPTLPARPRGHAAGIVEILVPA